MTDKNSSSFEVVRVTPEIRGVGPGTGRVAITYRRLGRSLRTLNIDIASAIYLLTRLRAVERELGLAVSQRETPTSQTVRLECVVVIGATADDFRAGSVRIDLVDARTGEPIRLNLEMVDAMALRYQLNLASVRSRV